MALGLKNGGKKPSPAVKKTEPWALKLIALARDGDRGLGDVIQREIGWKGDGRFDEWFAATFGKICKGGWTVETVNQRWPLNN